MDKAAVTVEALVGIGISTVYAHQLVTSSDSARDPSLALALHINRELGVKLGPIADLAEDEIAVLDRITPPPKLGGRAA